MCRHHRAGWKTRIFETGEPRAFKRAKTTDVRVGSSLIRIRRGLFSVRLKKKKRKEKNLRQLVAAAAHARRLYYIASIILYHDNYNNDNILSIQYYKYSRSEVSSGLHRYGHPSADRW